VNLAVGGFIVNVYGGISPQNDAHYLSNDAGSNECY